MLFVAKTSLFSCLEMSSENLKKIFEEFDGRLRKSWSKAVNQLSFKNESKVILSMKTSARNRNGSDMRFPSRYSTGPFRNHVLGVLFFPKLTLIRALLRKKTPLSH